MHVEVDQELCEANGVCMGIEPAVFDLRDDDVLDVLQPDPPAELHENVRLAVERCPRQALTLTE